MYIIAGLGNPTSQYSKTRHNVGFDAIDELAKELDVKIDNKKFKGEYGFSYIGNEKIMLLKPQTYMNLSGESIKAAVDFYKVNPEDEVIVLYDDITLDVGKIRVRKKGSAGGHNGMKSIISCLQTDEFTRIRIGVGDKGRMDLADFVLSRFNKEERILVDEGINKASKAVSVIILEDIITAQNKFN